jgi:hypothetical protein
VTLLSLDISRQNLDKPGRLIPETGYIIVGRFAPPRSVCNPSV